MIIKALFISMILCFSRADEFKEFLDRLENSNQQKPCMTCIISISGSSSHQVWDETQSVEPFRDALFSSDARVICGEGQGNWQKCMTYPQKGPSHFKFVNAGTNRIIPRTQQDQNREWSFYLLNGARQDLYFVVTDSANQLNSQRHEAYYMIFPREVLPSIRQIDGQNVVTLPNRETIHFDPTGHTVVGGVLTELSPITEPTQEISPAKLKYSGSGVLVKAVARGEEPRFGSGFAEIQKGSRFCKVPKKDLWPDQKQDSDFIFKFSSDQEFSNYLVLKCGFGIN